MKYVLVLLALAACPSFHPAPLPGSPAGATFVDIDGVHVHYRETGAGPAVVMIHGFGASLESWAGVVPEVSKDHRVITVDLKGFGWTSRPEGDYSPAAQAHMVWGVLDKLGVTDVAIVGHSWGTSVALSMAVEHPERTRRVALYDAYVYDEQVPSFFRWSQKSGLGEVLFGLFYTERIEDRAPLAYYDERWITQPRVDRVEADLARPGTTAAALAAARGHHFARLHEQLASFTRPVLLLWGANDEVTPVSYGYRLANELHDADIRVYEHCGHIPMVEAHSRSTRDLVEFLAKDQDHGHASGAGNDSGGSDRGSGDDRGGGSGSGGSGDSAGGGGGGGASATSSVRIDGDVATHEVKPGFGPPPANIAADLPIGADLAAVGGELTPRLYAAPREHTQAVIHGSVRVRTGSFYNLDLDRGLDTTGKPIFPVPLGGGQSLESSDLRARTDVALYAKGIGVAVKARIDWLDNVALGGDPDLTSGSPATSTGQRPSAVVVRRAWGEALTPAGIISVGRQGAHYGLGIAANGGDCEDCDHSDSADRFAFVSPLFGHMVGISYDIASSGPFTRSRDGSRTFGLEPSDKAAGPSVAIFKVHSPAALARRAAAGMTTLEYSAYLTRRTQDRDVPASYLPTAVPATTYTSNDLVARGFEATGTGGWFRLTNRVVRIEAELAYLRASLAQPSLIPGAAITVPVTSSQLGIAVESEIAAGDALKLGADGGYASGDSAPGFGAFPQPNQTSTIPGQFDGPQANLPRDHTVDNFRFHPDYHIDQILFREIIGTITDAIYIRPHARVRLLSAGAGHLEAGAALIASWAVEATSTPSGQRALGVEVDPELRFASRDGFAATVDYGVLFPGAGFNNTMLEAKPAQTIRARLSFAF